MKLATLLASIATFIIPLSSSPAAEVKIGVANAVSDAGIFIAREKGFFKDEGLTVEIIAFASGANMVAPLGTGQLDVGGGSAAAPALGGGVNRSLIYQSQSCCRAAPSVRGVRRLRPCT
jgi:NitT/TauT family transport system substrate-binding protein